MAGAPASVILVRLQKGAQLDEAAAVWTLQPGGATWPPARPRGVFVCRTAKDQTWPSLHGASIADWQSAAGYQRAVGISPTELTVRGQPDGSSGRMPEAPSAWASRPWPPSFL